MTTRKTKKIVSSVPEKPRFPLSFETFQRFETYHLNDWQSRGKEPSAFNGICNFKKYRVTIEEVPEPIEIVQARIRKLWEECNNHHQWDCIRSAGKSVGLELNHSDFGKGRRK